MFEEHINNFSSLFFNIDKNDEYEIMFYNLKNSNTLSIGKFINLTSYVKYKKNTDNLTYINETSLDIIYNYSNNKTYRISISGIETIKKIFSNISQEKNHIIFSVIVSEYHNSNNVTIIHKARDYKQDIIFTEYDIKCRVSKETPINDEDVRLLSNIQITENQKIFFRYKNRGSLIIFDNEDGLLKLDLTDVKSTPNFYKIGDTEKNFEVELEYNKGSKPLSETVFKKIKNNIIIIKQILENTNFIISNSEINNIISSYKKLVYNSVDAQYSSLYSMQPISAEISHLVDIIPNKYSVVDKTDGEKYQLFIYNKSIYLISNYFNVQKTIYSSSLNNTIIEGEFYKYTREHKEIYLFLMYDCLFYNNVDVRGISTLKERIQYLYKFCDTIKSSYYEIKEFTGDYNINNVELFYKNEVIEYFKHLNNLINKVKRNDIIFIPKCILFPPQGNNCEVYLLSILLWDCCTSNSLVQCPYLLDGIIYTGINQKYVRDKKQQLYPIYKYKPPYTNSLDFYVVILKNPDGSFLQSYDNSINNFGDNVPFRIVNFFVGDTVGNNEVPVLFMKEENNHEAFFPIDNNEIRDMEGKPICTNTVIEVIYTNDLHIPHQYRWKILRTRWDKTESVIKYKKQYGNFKDFAIRIWKSMKEAVTLEELKKLSNPVTYLTETNLLKQKTIVKTKEITDLTQQHAYYQKITSLGENFRAFHNWIKSNIISAYSSPFIKDNNIIKKNILDIGCGRGGDMMKFYQSKINNYVGIDPDYEGLFGFIDSASIRYKNNISKYADFPSMTFIQADARFSLDLDTQEKKLPKMKIENKNLITKWFDNKSFDGYFDVISYQLSLHYLIESNDSVNNVIEIHNKYLKKGGYVICTLLDAHRVMKLLNGRNTFTSWYNNENGQKQKFFEIIKQFDGTLADTYGQKIDVYMAWLMNENTTESEYLVTSEYLINIMKKCNCYLIETDYFANMYSVNKEWFLNVIEHEENPKSKKIFKSIAKFFQNSKTIDKESKVWNDLFRYYIFKKI